MAIGCGNDFYHIFSLSTWILKTAQPVADPGQEVATDNSIYLLATTIA